MFCDGCSDPRIVTLGTNKRAFAPLQVMIIRCDLICKLFSFRGTVTSQGIHIDLYEGGIHLTFPPNTVAESTRIIVYRWKYGARLPHLMEHEAVVGNVVEISAASEVGPLKLNGEVKLVLSHCAADLEGYERVMKRLIDKEKNVWEEIPRCEDIRKVAGNYFYLVESLVMKDCA